MPAPLPTGGPAAVDARARLERELAVFERYAAGAALGRFAVERLGQYAFALRPAGGGREIDLLMMALTHGNEYGGLPVLNAICADLESGAIESSISLGFLLCNVDAARQGDRFIERDMNRSFDRAETASLEDRRARAVEPVMKLARYCVDLHQTIEPSHTPFFVLAYQVESLRFAHAIFPQVPIVTHWGGKFSAAAGRTSDEFIHRNGGVGVSIELGQKGFCDEQIAAGAGVCRRAIAAVGALARGAELPVLSDQTNPLFSWSVVVPYPAGEVRLKEGLENFQAIQEGERLGTLAGVPIVAPGDGLLLFPKYVDAHSKEKPAELYRLLRRLTLGELGREDWLTSTG